MSTIEDRQIAGFADENGIDGKPVPSGMIAVPEEVWLDGDSIRWRTGKLRYCEVSRRMLNGFVSLKDPESVVRFAQNWGVLGISGGDVHPWTGGKLYRPGTKLATEGCEPIDGWFYFSRRASALLNIAAALKDDRLGDLQDWGEMGQVVDVYEANQKKLDSLLKSVESDLGRHMYGMAYSILVLHPHTRLNDARRFIGDEVGRWLDAWKEGKTSGLSDLALRWDETDKNKERRGWQIQIDYHGLLFPAIALQLALVVANAHSLYSCSGCGDPYIRERKRPKEGQGNYCHRCQEVAKQKAVRTYRGKKADAVRLYLSGKPAPEIAAELHTTVVRVEKWLKERLKQ